MSKELKQPDWCDYSRYGMYDATDIFFGCWYLKVHEEAHEGYCKKCIHYKY